jgi:hypothetical protein
MGEAALIRRIGAVYQDPKSWVVTGNNGMFVHPRSLVQDEDSLGETLSGGVKLALQMLDRMVLGL